MKYRRVLPCVRVLHLWTGLLTALYLMLLLVTGVAVNHSRALRLDKHYLSRMWLPSGYRVEEHAVRADVAAGDFHSGLTQARIGAPLLDAAAVLFLLSLGSAVAIFVLGGSVYTERNRVAEPLQPENTRGNEALSPFIIGSKPGRTAKLLHFRTNR